MSSWRARPLLLALVFLASSLGADESDLVERLFVARLEQPDVPLRVTSLRGGDVFEGSSDADGQLVFTLKVAQSDEVRFESASAEWRLDWVKPVRNAHLDPDIPLELDVGGFLRRVEKAPESATTRAPENDTETEAESGEAGEAGGAGDGADEPVCRRADDMRCLLRLQRSLAQARDRGDCRTALTLSQKLQSDLPEFSATDAGALALAELNLSCAFVETLDDDLYARRDLLLRRAVALAAGPDGAGWCHPQRSWILATAHGALRETASAAADARRARTLCPSSPAPYEWEFFFRLGLGQTSRAAEVAAETARAARDTGDAGLAELAAFLDAWSTYAAGECPDVERWIPQDSETSAQTPCTVLRDGICERARTSWILRCADDAQLARFGDALRSSLADTTSEAGPPKARRLEDLAEVESARERWDEAADLFAKLETGFGDAASPGRVGTWACRRGDALLRADRPAHALDAFESASRAWRGTEFSASRLDRLVVENNALVLSARVRGSVDEQRVDSVSERLEALDDDERFVPWRLAVENNLLELRTRADAERADVDAMRARSALERLREVEAEYRRHVESVILRPAREIGGEDARETQDAQDAQDAPDARLTAPDDRPRPCSQLAFAGHDGKTIEAVEEERPSAPQ